MAAPLWRTGRGDRQIPSGPKIVCAAHAKGIAARAARVATASIARAGRACRRAHWPAPLRPARRAGQGSVGPKRFLVGGRPRPIAASVSPCISAIAGLADAPTIHRFVDAGTRTVKYSVVCSRRRSRCVTNASAGSSPQAGAPARQSGRGRGTVRAGEAPAKPFERREHIGRRAGRWPNLRAARSAREARCHGCQ